MSAPGRPAGASRARGRGAPHPIALVAVAALSVQAGAALATTLFDRVGPLGAAWLRICFGALVLAAITWRPGRPRPPRGPGAVRWALAVGVAMAVMNTSFYGAIDRLPLGVAVAVELTGPLVVAVAATRRALDLAWVALAAGSVAALTLPRADLGASEGLGIVLALVAAAGWAAYIPAGRRLGRAWPGSGGLVLALAAGAVLTTPAGAAAAAGELTPAVIAVALGLGVLGTAIPYSLELAVLRRVRSGVFGVMMAMEPAVAALVGLAALGQVLEPLDALGIAGVALAVWGATRGAERAVPPPG